MVLCSIIQGIYIYTSLYHDQGYSELLINRGWQKQKQKKQSKTKQNSIKRVKGLGPLCNYLRSYQAQLKTEIKNRKISSY